MAKFLAQIIVTGTQIVAKAFARAVRQEIRASQEAAKQMGNRRAREHSINNAQTGLTLEEAKMILEVKDLSKEEIEKRFEFLFNANKRDKGGTFYLQSKVVRAKERLDLELESAGKEAQERRKTDEKT